MDRSYAAESLGSIYKGKQTGSFGDCAAISFNGNKIITGSTGGMFLTKDKNEAERIRKWSTQAREAAAWYEHEEVGYNYRMSNVIAGIVLGQWAHIDEHIVRKKEIYERYERGLKDLPVSLNLYDREKAIRIFGWVAFWLIRMLWRSKVAVTGTLPM